MIDYTGLVSKDRHEEALEILIKYHAEGDASAELPHVELAEIQAALKIENESRARGWAELFQTKGMRHRSLVAAALGMFVQFSGKLPRTTFDKRPPKLTLCR